MIDHTAATLAFRNRALGVSVCTTGATTLSATTTGYARTAGSFLTDGFAKGMEVTASGFTTAANNGQGVITDLTATAMMVSAYTIANTPTGYTNSARTLAAESAAAGRTITCTLPACRAWENIDFTPFGSVPFVEEDYVPATNTLITLPADTGQIEETGLYILKWYGLATYGVTAIRKSVDAVKALFAPGTSLTAGTNTVRVRTDAGPYAGQLLPQGNGWSVVVLTVPWRTRTTNAIAA